MELHCAAVLPRHETSFVISQKKQAVSTKFALTRNQQSRRSYF
jgi:hypothetical protein